MVIAGLCFAPMMFDQPGSGYQVIGELNDIDAATLANLDVPSGQSTYLCKLAGGLGFEPRLAESESAVLPLDDPPSEAGPLPYHAERLDRRPGHKAKVLGRDRHDRPLCHPH